MQADHQTSRQPATQTKLVSFPSSDFISAAAIGLQVLAARSHGLQLDHVALQRRHMPALPQAPIQPAA